MHSIVRGCAGSVIIIALLGSAGTANAVSAPAPLQGMTAKEERADKIWSLRAGLNVAALQCQFSPFLGTVPNYNALLRQHSDEMAESFKVMTGYFNRTKGRAGPRAFDTYATRANQSWASFDGQVSFCNHAAMLGRRALAVPKGKFGEFAAAELPALRESINKPQDALLAPRYEWAVVPTLSDPCKGRSRCR